MLDIIVIVWILSLIAVMFYVWTPEEGKRSLTSKLKERYSANRSRRRQGKP